MSRSYKFNDTEGTYFISFATVEWVDVFTRREYKDIVVESLKHCQEKKGLPRCRYIQLQSSQVMKDTVGRIGVC